MKMTSKVEAFARAGVKSLLETRIGPQLVALTVIVAAGVGVLFAALPHARAQSGGFERTAEQLAHIKDVISLRMRSLQVYLPMAELYGRVGPLDQAARAFYDRMPVTLATDPYTPSEREQIEQSRRALEPYLEAVHHSPGTGARPFRQIRKAIHKLELVWRSLSAHEDNDHRSRRDKEGGRR